MKRKIEEGWKRVKQRSWKKTGKLVTRNKHNTFTTMHNSQFTIHVHNDNSILESYLFNDHL